MNNTSKQDKIAGLEQQVQDILNAIAELKKEDTSVKVEQYRDWKWKPEVGERYYFVSTAGSIFDYEFTDCNTEEEFYSLGNIFQTREQAESELKARKIVAQLWRCEGARGFIMGENNFTFAFYENNLEIDSYEYALRLSASPYYDSKDATTQATQQVGEQNIIDCILWYSQGKVF